MERLTDKNHNAINKCGEYSSCYSCHKEICYIKELEEKLGELEDILEKYGIDNLDDFIKEYSSRNIKLANDNYALEQELAKLKKQLEKKEKLIERLQGVIDKLRDKKFAGKTLVEAVNAVYEPLFKNKCDEVEEFKQQLHELPKKIVGEIKDKIPEIGGMKCEIIIDDSLTLNTLLDTILKKYGGEDE